jgi:hypothetical protein
MMDHPQLIRNIAMIGHLHHGKTTLMDLFVRQTHPKKEWKNLGSTRYTNKRFDEQERELSIKATPMSLVLPNLADKSYLLNIMDTPGHVNFSDEQTAGAPPSNALRRWRIHCPESYPNHSWLCVVLISPAFGGRCGGGDRCSGGCDGADGARAAPRCAGQTAHLCGAEQN